MKRLHTLCRLLFVLLAGASQLAMAAEEPEYELVATHGEVEFRHYGAAIHAVTEMTESGGGFRQLAGFIFGGNDTGESIAMTAPVQQDLGGEHRHMAFIMPAEYNMESLPRPREAAVQLREVPARTVAVKRFSGRATASRTAEQRRLLAAELKDLGAQARGEWSLNQYNPPWTPGFMRRNEIWVEVDWPLVSASPAASAE